MTSVIKSLESYSPKVQNTFTLSLSTKVPQRFIWEDRQHVEFLSFFVNYIMKILFLITWAVPKFDVMIVAILEKLSEILRD